MLDAGDTPGTTIGGIDFTAIAEGYGAEVVHARGLDHLRAVLAEATQGPRLIQVDTVATAPNA